MVAQLIISTKKDATVKYSMQRTRYNTINFLADACPEMTFKIRQEDSLAKWKMFHIVMDIN